MNYIKFFSVGILVVLQCLLMSDSNARTVVEFEVNESSQGLSIIPPEKLTGTATAKATAVVSVYPEEHDEVFNVATERARDQIKSLTRAILKPIIPQAFVDNSDHRQNNQDASDSDIRDIILDKITNGVVATIPGKEALTGISYEVILRGILESTQIYYTGEANIVRKVGNNIINSQDRANSSATGAYSSLSGYPYEAKLPFDERFEMEGIPLDGKNAKYAYKVLTRPSGKSIGFNLDIKLAVPKGVIILGTGFVEAYEFSISTTIPLSIFTMPPLTPSIQAEFEFNESLTFTCANVDPNARWLEAAAKCVCDQDFEENNAEDGCNACPIFAQWERDTNTHKGVCSCPENTELNAAGTKCVSTQGGGGPGAGGDLEPRNDDHGGYDDNLSICHGGYCGNRTALIDPQASAVVEIISYETDGNGDGTGNNGDSGSNKAAGRVVVSMDGEVRYFCLDSALGPFWALCPEDPIGGNLPNWYQELRIDLGYLVPICVGANAPQECDYFVFGNYTGSDQGAMQCAGTWMLTNIANGVEYFGQGYVLEGGYVNYNDHIVQSPWFTSTTQDGIQLLAAWHNTDSDLCPETATVTNTQSNEVFEFRVQKIN